MISDQRLEKGVEVSTVKLHRCKVSWLKAEGHPCWRVQHALNDAGIEYEVVGEPYRKAGRSEIVRLTGEHHLPVIEFSDGTAYREESDAMAVRIREGKLFEGRG
jgi:hypothetical protein